MRLIDADLLMVYLHTQFFYESRDRSRVYKTIQDQPTVQPERKTGRWIYQEPPEGYVGISVCPLCGDEFNIEPKEYNYCPNCGAKMEEGDTE